MDRDVAGAQGLDFLGDDLAHHHPVTELGEARSGDQADPARPHDPYGLPVVQAPGLGSSVMPLAISSISRSVSDSARVLETQNEPSSSCQAIIRRRSPS